MRWMNPVRKGWPVNMYKYMFVCLSTISSEQVGGLLVLLPLFHRKFATLK